MLYLHCSSSAVLRSYPQTGKEQGGGSHWIGLALQAMLKYFLTSMAIYILSIQYVIYK